MNKPDELWCDHCECSPCCCYERQMWADEGGQLERSYEPDMETEINKVLDKLEEEEDYICPLCRGLVEPSLVRRHMDQDCPSFGPRTKEPEEM